MDPRCCRCCSNSARRPTSALSGNGDTMMQLQEQTQSLWAFATPQLSTSLTHQGNFNHGQTGAKYTITVKNVGDRVVHAGPSSAVNLVDRLPAGITATDIQGSGSICTLATVSCTRSDGLAVGASFPFVTVTVTIATNAPAVVTNTATASGGGSNWGERNGSNRYSAVVSVQTLENSTRFL